MAIKLRQSVKDFFLSNELLHLFDLPSVKIVSFGMNQNDSKWGWVGWWSKLKDKDHISPAKVETWADLGKNIIYLNLILFNIFSCFF